MNDEMPGKPVSSFQLKDANNPFRFLPGYFRKKDNTRSLYLPNYNIIVYDVELSRQGLISSIYAREGVHGDHKEYCKCRLTNCVNASTIKTYRMRGDYD
jgi:hypothetical protein